MRANIPTPRSTRKFAASSPELNKTWNTRTINTWARSFSVCGRSWECPQPTFNILNGNIYNQCIDMGGECLWLRRWNPPSTVGKNYVSNSDIYKKKIRGYWECVQHYSKVGKRKNILNRFWMWNAWRTHHIHWARSVLANDQAIVWANAKSTCLCWFRTMCWTDERHSRSNRKDGKVKWKDSGCIRLAKMQWVSVEKQLNSSGQISSGFSSLSILQRNPTRLGETKRSSQRSSQTGSSSCQCSQWHLSGTRMMKIVFRMPEKSRIAQWDSRNDIGHSWGPGSWVGREVVWKF